MSRSYKEPAGHEIKKPATKRQMKRHAAHAARKADISSGSAFKKTFETGAITHGHWHCYDLADINPAEFRK
jgi:hypothetical protein